MLRHFVNHDYLLRSIGLEGTRNLYGTLESILDWDFHYWLQRGSVEVEEGDLGLARLFLSHARSTAEGDSLVENEWAYLLFREAIDNPGAKDAPELVEEATSILEDLIGQTQPCGLISLPCAWKPGLGMVAEGNEKVRMRRASILRNSRMRFRRESDCIPESSS